MSFACPLCHVWNVIYIISQALVFMGAVSSFVLMSRHGRDISSSLWSKGGWPYIVLPVYLEQAGPLTWRPCVLCLLTS